MLRIKINIKIKYRNPKHGENEYIQLTRAAWWHNQVLNNLQNIKRNGANLTLEGGNVLQGNATVDKQDLPPGMHQI